MAITLGTNVSSLIANGNLSSATNSLQKIMERLSSGLKINRAGDDAAGLVISENMEAQISSSKQAQQNIQTAKSFLTVAEDGMVSISDHMQRINDLLTNMANDTNDISSRTASINEIIERLDEINRLAETTNFNGRKMLDGSQKSIIVQMGSDVSENSIIEIGTALTDCHTYDKKTLADGSVSYGMNIELPDNLNPYKLTSLKYKVNAGGGEQTLAGPLYQTTIDGKKVYATEEVTSDNKTPDYYELVDDGAGKTTIQKYTYKEASGAYEKSGAAIQADSDSIKKEQDFDPNNTNCRSYLAKIQDAISIIAEKRGLLGAYENRMDSSYDSMTTRIESLEDAKISYTDADIAEESTKYSNAQILQQINVSMLAAANSMQSMALSLLGG